MDVIIDANILFAALIKDGKTIECLLEKNVHLFAPEFLMEEFRAHKEEILKKTKRTPEEFNEILEIFQDIITFIPKEECSQFLSRAETISQDKDDAAYVAVALKMNIPLWSNDKKLKQQQEIKVYSTKELLEILQKTN